MISYEIWLYQRCSVVSKNITAVFQDLISLMIIRPQIMLLRQYCKRWYFRVINFSCFAAQKHIRGLLNSRWADAHL